MLYKFVKSLMRNDVMFSVQKSYNKKIMSLNYRATATSEYHGAD